ncbi:monoheme c-type cytochrome [Campylobacter iguaniorum]|uniref:Monoheme c-type cytochrome n=1 Tax=Campylobacter iguaniorum TaxID=1244531 RepID=A0A076F9Q5_9BACT|nr:lipoprotein [Campylobacter iguaniorum]AII14413.1 monoheme c-type cytochrome [Campylobacter iguaniorum]ALV24148.1 monoheme c-type cytochrome [Campylobacter iguaniorum]
MKKLVIFSICALCFLGCSSEDKKAVQEIEQNTTTTSITVKKGDALQNTQNQWMSYDMDGQKRVKFGLGNENNETTKSIGALALTRTPLQSINKALIRGRLSNNFLIKCSACHDDYANGIIGPSLLAKTNDEIFNMINAYKTKTKANVLMADLVKKMDEKEIRALADEISKFNEQFRSKK